VAWLVVIGLIAALNYSARFAEPTEPRPDALFRWSTALGTIVLETLIVLLMLLIARGLSLRDAFALRAPTSWPQALRIAAVALAATWTTSFIIEATVGHTAREQALPQYWDPERVPAFFASAFAIAVLVPVAEELTCRGLGFTLLARWGEPVAIGGTALAFALAHGAVLDLPWVLVVGIGLGYLRARTGSIYPCIGLHATVNGIAVIAIALLGRSAAN
jgi:membrane protease YdiL (CAAX protease family)